MYEDVTEEFQLSDTAKLPATQRFAGRHAAPRPRALFIRQHTAPDGSVERLEVAGGWPAYTLVLPAALAAMDASEWVRREGYDLIFWDGTTYELLPAETEDGLTYYPAVRKLMPTPEGTAHDASLSAGS